MSMPVRDIRAWLATLDDDDEVGIDDGGLTLHVVGAEPTPYLEIGGLPEKDAEDGEE